MTSEREEFIDFVSPYYEQSGLIISKSFKVLSKGYFHEVANNTTSLNRFQQ
jgi:hypothetical protein